MEIRFRTRKLEKQYINHREAIKAFGKDIADKYILRINIIKQVKDISELKTLPGLRCHALKGKREGQWSIYLNKFYRLIFSLEGAYLQIVCIEEVSKHYDE